MTFVLDGIDIEDVRTFDRGFGVRIKIDGSRDNIWALGKNIDADSLEFINADELAFV